MHIILVLSFIAPKVDCKVDKFNDGWARRRYVGRESTTESGRSCLNWKNVEAAQKYLGKQGVGDHKFCRNSKLANMKREFCYVSHNTTEFCRVRTCGNFVFNPS